MFLDEISEKAVCGKIARTVWWGGYGAKSAPRSTLLAKFLITLFSIDSLFCINFDSGMIFLVCTVDANFFILFDASIFCNSHLAALFTHKTVKGMRRFFPLVFKHFWNVHDFFFGSIHHVLNQWFYNLVRNLCWRNAFFPVPGKELRFLLASRLKGRFQQKWLQIIFGNYFRLCYI